MRRCAVLLAAACTATIAAAQPRCGVDRWEVKVLRDPDARTVVRAAEPTTIAALIGLPEPRMRPPVNGRDALERRVFRVRGLIVTRSAQADRDLHVVLADPADRTKRLIVELPDSACAVGSRFASDFAESRRVLDRLPDGIELEVEGVAFWDDEHGQIGVADNGIELHPVLSIAPVQTKNDILMVDVGAVESDTTAVRVWVNLNSRVYHCPGTANYGTTARGQYMPEPEAVRAGARPAGGRRCR